MTSKNNKIKLQRILHITRIAKGGVPVVLDQIVRGLDRRYFEPVVLFDTPQSSEIRDKLVSSKIQTIELSECRDVVQEQKSAKVPRRRNIGGIIEDKFGKSALGIYLSIKSAWYFFRYEVFRVSVYFRILKKNRIDLVHTHSDLCHAKPEIIAAKLAGVLCVTHRHGYSNYTWFDKLFTWLVEKNIYISSDIACYHANQGEEQEKGVIIHNGINPADYGQKYDIKEIRQELECEPDQILIGLVARLDWWKGHEFFIEAMAEVAQQYNNIKGLIIGGIAELHYASSQRYLDSLHKMVKSLDLQEIITFTGHRSDIPRILSVIDVVVHASSTPEPFGLTVIEGMAAGKPVVATAAGGVLDIIEDGKSGLLVSCKDSKAMAKAIMLLLGDHEKAEHIKCDAKQRVAEKFTIERQVAAVQMLYGDVLDIKRKCL